MGYIDPRSILLALIPVGLTLINYAIIRDLIWGIFLGSKTKKAAVRIKSEQSGWQKFTQNYIAPLLSKHQGAFKKWTFIKRFAFFFAIAQVIGFFLMIFFGVQFWIVATVCGVICLANVVLFIIMMNMTRASDVKHDRKGSPWKFEQ
ncbi:MAG: hypothetical protein K6E36_03085 [Oscillospiraceae bacterium]|jgi:hypothetical protein|nr:hypothetical protein [Oscillospiraceae bacterium]MCR5305467.1 hypothetical protein [Oscillospiraceae bacterium]